MTSYSPPRRSLGARVLRILGRILVSLVVLIVVASVSVYGMSQRMLYAKHVVPDHSLTVPTDSATVARGEHIASIRGCMDCHGPDFSGRMVIDAPAIGSIGGANLTSGRTRGALSDRDWERAVRHGVRRDGTALVFMPSNEFTGLSDEDLAAIVAYVRTRPAVVKPTLPVKLGPLIRALAVAKQVNMAVDEVDHSKTHPTSVPVSATPTYGKYLAQGCTGCHGEGFSGGKIPGAPPDWKPAANLTPTGIGRYSLNDFTRILRTGKRPDGSAVDTLMPWKMTQHMTDTEIEAIFRYLQTVPPRAYGLR